VLGTLTRAAKARLANEENLRLLQRETAHRAKNQIAIASALTRLSARGATSVKQFSDDVSARLTALGRSVDMMAARPGAPVKLKELAQTQLEPFAGGHAERLQLVGEDMSVAPALAQSLGLVLHECATNASKYGAWSRPDGVVRIEWREEDGGLVMTWTEQGGPPPPDQRGAGFGSSLIEMLIERSLGGAVTRDYRPEGLVATFRLPKGAGEG
jgi:two-component sensor histidine kinase